MALAHCTCTMAINKPQSVSGTEYNLQSLKISEELYFRYRGNVSTV